MRTSICGCVFIAFLPSIVFHGINHSKFEVNVPAFASKPSLATKISLYLNTEGINSLYVWNWSKADFVVAFSSAGFFNSIITIGSPFMNKRMSGLLLFLSSMIVNWFTIIEERNNRRPDILLFINGLPIVIIELKNPADENATTKSAFDQFKTYKLLIPSVFRYNEILVASDGLEAKAGTITSNWEWFIPWKTIDGKKAIKTQPQIEVLTKGIYPKVLVNKEK